MLGEWHSKEKKWDTFSHWKLSLGKEVTDYICESLHLNLYILYHEACEQGKSKYAGDKKCTFSHETCPPVFYLHCIILKTWIQ